MNSYASALLARTTEQQTRNLDLGTRLFEMRKKGLRRPYKSELREENHSLGPQAQASVDETYGVQRKRLGETRYTASTSCFYYRPPGHPTQASVVRFWHNGSAIRDKPSPPSLATLCKSCIAHKP